MSGNRVELLLFDAAGTLIEPSEPVESVYQRHFAARGWETDAAVIRAGFRETFAGLGEPAFSLKDNGNAAEREWWRQVVDRTALSAGIDPAGADFADCFNGLFDHYARGDAWRPFSEVAGVLERLKGTGVKMAVVSNFDRRLHRVLEELDLAKWFDLVLTSADVRARKPSPRLLDEAMDRLGVTPAKSRLTGDSEHADGGAAKAAGVPLFLLNRPRITLTDFVNWLPKDFS